MEKIPNHLILESIHSGERIHFENPWQNPEAFQQGKKMAALYLQGTQTAFIDGKSVTSHQLFFHHNPNPTYPEVFGSSAITEPGDIEHALQTAAKSNREWGNPDNLQERIAVVDRFGALVFENRFTLYGLMALSQGKNGLEAWRDGQELIDFITEYRRFPQVLDFLRQGLRSDGKTTLRPTPAGVIGVWAPFNFACIGAGETIAALMMGNSVILHPSPRNIGPYRFIAEMMYEAGVPADRLQFIIPDPTNTSLSREMAADPRITQISFTGSHAVAKEIDMIMARKRQKTGRLDYHIDIEAGGRNPIIVTGLPYTDSVYAVERIVDSMIGYQGQKCSALGELLIVGKNLGNSLTEALVERLQQVKIKPTTEPDSDMGALIDKRAFETVKAQIETVVNQGGTIITGGMQHSEIPGAIVPTLYEDLPETTPMGNAEIFGPVAQVRIVESINEAIARARRMGYALTAGVMAETIEEAQTIAAQLNHGVTYVNDGCTAAPVPQMPFGGAYFSGSGTLLKPGSAGHPLQFSRLRSLANVPRKEW